MLTSGPNGRFGHTVRKAALAGVVTVGTMTGVLASGVGVASAADKARALRSRSASSATPEVRVPSGPVRSSSRVPRPPPYWNADLGGLEGHKVNLYICENQSTPAGGQSCANDMVQHGVVAVVEPFTGQGQTEVPTIVGAGIPYIVVTGASTAEPTTPGAYALEGGFPAYLGAMALSAKQHGYKKVAFLVENVPAAIQGAQALGGIVSRRRVSTSDRCR